MKKTIFLFCVIVSLFAEVNNKIIYNYSDYEKIVNNEAKKQFNEILEKQVKDFGITLDKEDFNKIEENAKKNIEKELTGKLKDAYSYYNNLEDFTGFTTEDIKKEIEKIIKKEVEKEFNKQINDSIYDSFSKTYGSGDCCCTPEINKNINSISKYFTPKIKKESILVGETAKLLEKIRENTYKSRLKDSKWQNGTMGENIVSTLGELYFLIKNREIVSENDSQEFLKIEAELNLLKNKIIEDKIKIYQIKKR